MKKVAVIGAGPAGLMAAGKAGERGHEIALIEKNTEIGKKLLISGKGRCNITNITDIEGLIRNIPGNGNFLYSAFNKFSNTDLIDFLNKRGVKTKVERGGRVFPLSDEARDILKALKGYIRENNVKVMLNSPAIRIEASNGSVRGVALKNGDTVKCDSVILAAGGASYPKTGTTGDGYKMAEELGHTIKPLKPSLVPLVVEEPWVGDLQGLSLKNVSIKLLDKNGNKIYNDFGEMIFTHFGVSGPIILSCSRHALNHDYRNIKLIIDLKPALTEEKLYERIKRDFDMFSRKQYKNSLGELLPQKMIPVIISLTDIPHDKPVNQVTREERKKLCRILKNLELNIKGARPIEEAIITAGGVSTDEINPSTMESKIVKWLYFAGEIIDVDGYTGGFNLTIAFSTGCLAGMSV